MNINNFMEICDCTIVKIDAQSFIFFARLYCIFIHVPSISKDPIGKDPNGSPDGFMYQ